MTDPASLVSLASAGTLAIGLTAVAALKGWQQWLDLRRSEIDAGRHRRGAHAAARPGIAELRARVRRLEAIANGAER